MTDRQTLFSGTEAPSAHLAIDAQSLGRYLNRHLEGMSGPLEVVKFKGGQSNPTYKISGRDKSYVLRRRPPGQLLESAHAIDREYRVLSALSKGQFPVPHPHLYCADESVIGSAFYVVDYQEGRIFWNAEMPGMDPGQRAAIYDRTNALLARLHDLDVDALGLGDFGKPSNYIARNLARWSKQYVQSQLVEVPDMDWLMKTLPERLPRSESTALIHGDFGLYNIIVHPTNADVVAVLDWELATLGDPLTDLAHHLMPWWNPPDRVGGSATSLIGFDLGELGIPSMEDYIALYCQRRGLSAIPDLTFHLSYAAFRYAAIVQGILKRAKDGANSSRKVLHTQDRVFQIAATARRTLSQAL